MLKKYNKKIEKNKLEPMIYRAQRVAAIHDLSGIGRNSLTAIIPVFSTLGIQVCPLPTSVLSTQTDGYKDFAFLDLTDFMKENMEHWQQLGITFDCIYSGFLGSPRQADLVIDFISKAEEDYNPLVVIDPVFGDDGELYGTMNMKMVEEMRELIAHADIITPNFTEAAMLLGEDYNENISRTEIKKWLVRLADMGPHIVVITSAPWDKDGKTTNVLAYDSIQGAFWRVPCTYIPCQYPGTGDIFTSVFIANYLLGNSLPVALEKGVQFVSTAIRASFGHDYARREGVILEKVLDSLQLPIINSSYEWLEDDINNPNGVDKK